MSGGKARLTAASLLMAVLGLLVWADRQAPATEAAGMAPEPGPVCDHSSYRDRVLCGRGVSDERMVRERTLTVLPSEIDERTLPADFHEAHRMVAHAAAERAAGRTTRVRVTLKAERERAKPKPRAVAKSGWEDDLDGSWLPVECEHYRRHLGRVVNGAYVSWETVDRLERRCIIDLRWKRRNK